VAYSVLNPPLATGLPPSPHLRCTTNRLVLVIGLALLGTEYVLWSKLPFDVLRFGALCLMVIVFLLWQRRDALALESGPAPSVAGALLIAFVLFKSVSQSGTLFAALSPLLSGVALALLASGFKGLRQFWKELALLVFLPFPFVLRLVVSDFFGLKISPATAFVGSGLARLLGWQVSTQGVVVDTPGGTVGVYEGCSGIHSMFFLFGLAILLLVLVPPPGRLARWAAIPAAIAVAFTVNACRVALLVILVSESRREAFHYWHLGSGALLFESASVFCFVLLYRFVFLAAKPADPPPPHAALG
jgi:cyanoexosortase A